MSETDSAGWNRRLSFLVSALLGYSPVLNFKVTISTFQFYRGKCCILQRDSEAETGAAGLLGLWMLATPLWVG